MDYVAPFIPGGTIVTISATTASTANQLATAASAASTLRVVNETTGAAARALRSFPDGSFDAFVPLAPGSNRIAVRVTTTDGGRAEDRRSVTRTGAAGVAGERALLLELQRRTRETEVWAEMERERRGPRREIEIRVEPGTPPR